MSLNKPKVSGTTPKINNKSKLIGLSEIKNNSNKGNPILVGIFVLVLLGIIGWAVWYFIFRATPGKECKPDNPIENVKYYYDKDLKCIGNKKQGESCIPDGNIIAHAAYEYNSNIECVANCFAGYDFNEDGTMCILNKSSLGDGEKIILQSTDEPVTSKYIGNLTTKFNSNTYTKGSVALQVSDKNLAVYFDYPRSTSNAAISTGSLKTSGNILGTDDEIGKFNFNLTSDGILQVEKPDKTIIWKTQTINPDSSNGPYMFVYTPDFPYLKIINNNNEIVWSPRHCCYKTRHDKAHISNIIWVGNDDVSNTYNNYCQTDNTTSCSINF